MKRRAWLLAAVALLAAAAWLMWRGESKVAPAPEAHVEFPRYAKPEENARNQKRRTLPPQPKKDEEGYRQKRDPVLVALPPTKGKSAVVFEASALRDSPVGKLWLDCMLSKRDLEQIEHMKNDYGVDVVNDVDRFAASSDKVAVVSGNFAGARWDKAGTDRRAYGDKGAILEAENGRAFAVWGDGMVLMGSPKSLEEAIDRLEDRAPPAPPPIPDWASYGDVYGVLSPEDFAKMLPDSEREIADRLRGALSQVELHVDASEDVAIVADAVGDVPGDVDDLGKSLGAALSLGRLKAQSDGDDKLAELMELARVSPHKGRFSVDLALPIPVIQRQMGPCKRDRESADGGA